MKTLTNSLLLAASILGLVAAAPLTAQAASGSDLETAISNPGPVPVGVAARYTVNITNTGNRNSANPTTVTVQLPVTVTSPTVRVMGTVSNLSPGCALSGTRVVCTIASVPRFGGTASVGFDMALPYSTAPMNFRADATTANERDQSDNSATMTASQTYTVVSDAAPFTVTNRHCTGTNLSSFFECLLYPSSISSHTATLLPGGTIDLSANPDAGSATGTWSVNGTQLSMTYTDNGDVLGSFVGQGVDANCWEGRMTFPNSTYLSMYRVCR
jgi:hypothetical protein